MFCTAPASANACPITTTPPSTGFTTPCVPYSCSHLPHKLTVHQFKDAVTHRNLHARKGLRARLAIWWDQVQGWLAAALIGLLTALVAYAVDVSVAVVSDWKDGYCAAGVFRDRATCCGSPAPQGAVQARLLVRGDNDVMAAAADVCAAWKPWSQSWTASYAVYTAFALLFGIVAGAVTMTTRASLPAVDDSADAWGRGDGANRGKPGGGRGGKTMYMAAGSGIPEIKTILSGFVIPHFLDFKVLLVKAVGSTFAVATGMCLGKEGPFVHISTCVGYIVATCFPKYRQNERKLREILSVACSAGLSVAFGAPIGGVLFSYEV